MKTKIEKHRQKPQEHTGVSATPVDTDALPKRIICTASNYNSAEALKAMDNYEAGDSTKLLCFAGALNLIKKNHWYRGYGYGSFEEMVNNHLGMSISVLELFVGIFEFLKSEEYSPETLKYVTKRIQRVTGAACD